MTDHICAIALRERAFLWWWIAFIPASLLSGLLLVAIVWLFYAGVGIWGIDWPVAWGFALIGYVWWIAIASGGTFTSALFYLVKVEWRTSINRIAETMTLFAAACAGIYPILHLGRPWLFYWLFPYPDTMRLWPQFRSPLLWDFFAILTYVISSILFWYLGLLPDLATVRDRATTRGKQILYGAMAMGFRGSDRQWRHYHAAYGVLAAIMAPLVVSVHSIVGLDFAGAATVGWHSTQFPPFFVFGALLSGFATVLLLIVPLRRLLHLQDVITGRHFDVLCRLMLVSSLMPRLRLHDGCLQQPLRPRSGRQTIFLRQAVRVLFAGLLGHHPVQHPYSSAHVVSAAAPEPGGGPARQFRRDRRHVVRTLHDRRHGVAPHRNCRPRGAISTARSGIGRRCSAPSACS